MARTRRQIAGDILLGFALATAALTVAMSLGYIITT